MAVRAHLAIALRQRRLGELGGHAEEAGDDHPERGTRPADGNRDRHASDIAEPDGGGERGGECLERTDLAAVVRGAVLAAQHGEGVTHHAQVDEAQAQGEIHRTDDEPGHDERHCRFTGKDVMEDDACQIAVDDTEERVDGAGFGRVRGLRKEACGKYRGGWAVHGVGSPVCFL